MPEKVAIKNGQSIETDNCITEDHTYVTGEIYQRVIAIRKSKKDR
jgi:hypothetical protein